MSVLSMWGQTTLVLRWTSLVPQLQQQEVMQASYSTALIGTLSTWK